MSDHHRRLGDVAAAYHHTAVTAHDFNRAAAVLTRLLSKNLPASEIAGAVEAAAAETDNLGVAVLLRHARARIIGGHLTDHNDDDTDLAAARAANDQINAHLCDVEHRKSA